MDPRLAFALQLLIRGKALLLKGGILVSPFIFDDPLQNMDELTSTALARGLAKLIRLQRSLGGTERRTGCFARLRGVPPVEQRFHIELRPTLLRRRT